MNFGSISLYTSIHTALSAYLASITASHELADRIRLSLSEPNFSSEQEVACIKWTAAGFDLVVQPKAQRCWITIAAVSKLAEVRSTFRPMRLAHVAADSQPHSGDWPKAISIEQIENRLDNHSLSIGIAIGYGLQICQTCLCRCGSMIDLDDLHPLSCRHSAGKFPRQFFAFHHVYIHV